MYDPTLDQPGLLTGTGEFLAGVIFFPSIFLVCEILLHHSKTGRELCEHYQINNNGIHDISNKVTSSTFAVFACTIGWFVNQQCTGDIMQDRFYVLDNYLIFGVSYFFYDVVSMYLVYNTLTKDHVTVSYLEVTQFLSDRPLIVFHHILVPLIGFPALMYFRNGYGDCLLGTSFMIEASTPFVSLRVILVHLNMKVITLSSILSSTYLLSFTLILQESLLYMINGIMMLLSFFLCRVMLFPILYWWYSNVLDISLISTIISIPCWVHVATFSLWFPQLFWFNKMLKGSLKVIKDRQRRSDKSCEIMISSEKRPRGETYNKMD